MIKRILSVAALATMIIAMLPMASCSGNKTAETQTSEASAADSSAVESAGTETNADVANADTASAEASETNPTDSNKPVKIKFKTTKGDFTVLLYDDTPLHRDNMVKLVNEHFYDGLLFHRVIKDFMVQGGDPDSKNAAPGQMLGSGDPGYTIPAEILPNHFHTRYALAAARTGDQVNPQRRSSGSQFYVVTGYKVDPAQLSSHVPADVAEKYATVGGAPFLDGQYTVYGEVVDGFETIDAIEGVRTGAADRPVDDVRIISASVVE